MKSKFVVLMFASISIVAATLAPLVGFGQAGAQNPPPPKPPAADAKASPIEFTGGFLVRLHVKDRKASMDWYRENLGFELLFEVPEINWCEMVNRAAKVTIGLGQTAEAKPGKDVTPIFGVRDIDAARAHLESRGVKFAGPTTTIEGLVKLASFIDPDGHLLMFYQSLGASE